MRQLKTNHYFLNVLLVLASAAGWSCQEKSAADVEIREVEVVQKATTGLTARINVRLSAESALTLRYRPVSSESELVLTSPQQQNHTVPVYQLLPGTSYVLEVTTGQNEVTYRGEFQTPPLPAAVTGFYTPPTGLPPDKNQHFILFHNTTKPAGLYLIGDSGHLLWYRTLPGLIKAARLTPQNTLLVLIDENDTPFADGNVLLETSLTGDTLFLLRKGEKGFDRLAHHDLQKDVQGNYVLITNESQNGFPGDGILVLDSHGNKRWHWTTFDEIKQIDPATWAQPWGNSLTIDRDGHYIVSFRALSQVWKIHSATGVVLWKLGKNGNVSIPASGEFLFQHFAHRNGADDLMLFDNGGPDRPLSRLLSFKINENTRQANLSTAITLPAELYSAIMGSTCLLPDGNLLATIAVKNKIVKIRPDGNLIWSRNTTGPIYRAENLANPFLSAPSP